MNQRMANEEEPYKFYRSLWILFDSPSAIAYLPDGTLAPGSQTGSYVRAQPSL